VKPESEIRNRIAEIVPDALFMDGYDDCIVGLVRRFAMESVVVYDEAKAIQKLMADGASQEEAEEFFEYNQIGAWMGEKSPFFLTWATQLCEGMLPVMDEQEEPSEKKLKFLL